MLLHLNLWIFQYSLVSRAWLKCLYSWEIKKINQWPAPIHLSIQPHGVTQLFLFLVDCAVDLVSIDFDLFVNLSFRQAVSMDLKLKYNLRAKIWDEKAKLHYISDNTVLQSGRRGQQKLSFPWCALSMSHDELCADSSWWAIDPPLGSPSGHHLSASLARAY